jgi:cold-inducible RNA-binding protein
MVKLYVCNINFDATEDGFREWLTEVQGYVVDKVQLIMSGETGKSRGFAFVTFETEPAAREALRDLEGEYFMNRPLHVAEATAKPRTGELRKSSSGGLAGQGPAKYRKKGIGGQGTGRRYAVDHGADAEIDWWSDN